MKESFILFKRVPKLKNSNPMGEFHQFMIREMVKEFGEGWKNKEAEETTPKEDTILQFICEATSPKEVAKLVRKDPLAKYVLFRGAVQEIQVPIHVLADGINLDSEDQEGWK